jgi:large repetitive protein
LEENFDRINCKIHKEKEMADFRRWFTALAVPLVFAGIASAQVTGGGTTPLTCNVNTSATPILRSEGITEQVGDIVITCSGGAVLPNGAAASLVNITVSLTSQVTSRLLGTGASEALLLIDEPNSGLPAVVPGFGPGQPFTDCTTPNSGAIAGGCGPVTVLTQTGTDTKGYQTAVTSASPITAAPNVYQGLVSGNQVTFLGVPVVPPGTNGNRVFRITNVRINASGIGGGTASGSLPVQASISTSNPSALPISNPTPLVGFVQASLSTSVGGPIPFGQCNSQTLEQSAIFTFKELFASAFKTRVDPTVSGQTNGQGSSLVQDVPGTIYNSESGFTLSVTSTTGTGTAGLADFGTRFTAVFNNIPAGARLFVSNFSVAVSSTTGLATNSISSGNSWAQYVTNESTPDGNGTIPSGTVFGSTAPGGSGGIQVIEITPTTGTTATATWESIANQPTAIDTYNFAVYLTYTASPGTNSPAAGTGTANLRYGPASTATTATSGPIPRFLDTSTAKNAIQIGICRTILLYPFITNQAGFDTGIAIANTSTDPFGTTPQTGTCSLNWYGAAAPSTPTTTPTIPSATDFALLASATVPGFQGYMIAVCNFQFAHGFAFVSDVGARNLAMGYLPLIIPDPNLNLGRNANDLSKSVPSSGEQLGQ